MFQALGSNKCLLFFFVLSCKIKTTSTPTLFLYFTIWWNHIDRWKCNTVSCFAISTLVINHCRSCFKTVQCYFHGGEWLGEWGLFDQFLRGQMERSLNASYGGSLRICNSACGHDKLFSTPTLFYWYPSVTNYAVNR